MKQIKKYINIILTIFLKKVLIRVKLVILGLKMTFPHLQTEKAERYMKVISMVFPTMSFHAIVFSSCKKGGVIIQSDI